MSLPVVILAGGLATRLGPITEKTPKSLVDVAGEPFICRQLKYLQSQGIKKVTLCVGYLGEMIEAIVGSGSQFGVEVTYSSDGPILLGTGGAIKQALPLLSEHFFVLYGDSFLPINFSKVESAFVASQRPALMTILKNEDKWDKSNVTYLDNELVEYNKESPSLDMNYIDYGLGVLSASLFHSYEEGMSFDLSEIYNALSIKSELKGYPVFQRFYEIGSHIGLKEAEHFFITKGKEI
jgi:N-acetyl-alpha-D-muramate 1-phosphate uridylyltransferase